jgi:hypothetical protein
MWLNRGRTMGPSALVGAAALVAIEYVANGGQLTARPAADPTFHVRLERGMCLGACPHYQVDIDAKGAVTFNGSRSYIEPSVACQGERQWNVSPSQVAHLEALIDRSGFFRLKNAYRGDITDMAQRVVTVTRRGRTKSVTDYAGQMAGMPQMVIEIEDAIDAAANTRACVSGEGKR